VSKHPNPEEPPKTAVPFETSLTELEAVVRDLESGDLPLERAIQLFERGMTLSQTCRQQLEEAETRVEVLVRRGNQVKPEPLG
jgi:exodeoxyribonuclease VII small subunit